VENKAVPACLRVASRGVDLWLQQP
jgi:hypothetical protein